MPISLVTESKDVEPEGPDKPKITAGTWEFYHYHSTEIHLHVQPKDDTATTAPPTTTTPSPTTGQTPRPGASSSIDCYSRKTDRDVKYFFEKFLQRTMDEKSEAISNTKCVGNARLD